MSPFLLFLLKVVQRKQVLVHSCPWAQLSVEQSPVKSEQVGTRHASHPCSLMKGFHFPFRLRERDPRRGSFFAFFLYFPVSTCSSLRKGATEPSNLKGGIQGPENLQPYSVFWTLLLKLRGVNGSPEEGRLDWGLWHLLPKEPASGLNQFVTPLDFTVHTQVSSMWIGTTLKRGFRSLPDQFIFWFIIYIEHSFYLKLCQAQNKQQHLS